MGLNRFLFVFSILAHTSLQMSGGEIPARKYRSSTLVGFRHPVVAMHALFSSVSGHEVISPQAGAVYSAT